MDSVAWGFDPLICILCSLLSILSNCGISCGLGLGCAVMLNTSISSSYVVPVVLAWIRMQWCYWIGFLLDWMDPDSYWMDWMDLTSAIGLLDWPSWIQLDPIVRNG